MVLLAALGMLVAGETLLKGHLRGIGFLVYWGGCFALTGVAFLIAFLDVLTLRRRLREEQRELLDKTLRKIEAEAREKPHRPAGREKPAKAQPGSNGHVREPDKDGRGRR